MASEWKNIKSNPPPEGVRVLFCDTSVWIYIGYRENGKIYHTRGDEGGLKEICWMFIPDPPKNLEYKW